MARRKPFSDEDADMYRKFHDAATVICPDCRSAIHGLQGSGQGFLAMLALSMACRADTAVQSLNEERQVHALDCAQLAKIKQGLPRLFLHLKLIQRQLRATQLERDEYARSRNLQAAQLDAMQQERDHLAAQLAAMERDHQAALLAAMQQERDHLAAQLAAMERDHQAAQLAAMERERDRQAAQLADSLLKQRNHAAQLTDSLLKQRNQATQLSNLQEAHNRLATHLHTAKSELKRQQEASQRERDQLKQQLEASQRERDQLKQQLEASQRERDQLKQQQEALQRERDQLKQQLEASQESCDQLSNQLTVVQSELSAVGSERDQLRAAVVTQQQLSETQSALQSAQTELHLAQAEHAALAEELAQLRCETRGANALIEQLAEQTAVADIGALLLREVAAAQVVAATPMKCAHCGNSASSRCCNNIFYCNKKCQKENLKIHDSVCEHKFNTAVGTAESSKKELQARTDAVVCLTNPKLLPKRLYAHLNLVLQVRICQEHFRAARARGAKYPDDIALIGCHFEQARKDCETWIFTIISRLPETLQVPLSELDAFACAVNDPRGDPETAQTFGVIMQICTVIDQAGQQNTLRTVFTDAIAKLSGDR